VTRPLGDVFWPISGFNAVADGSRSAVAGGVSEWFT